MTHTPQPTSYTGSSMPLVVLSTLESGEVVTEVRQFHWTLSSMKLGSPGTPGPSV